MIFSKILQHIQAIHYAVAIALLIIGISIAVTVNRPSIHPQSSPPPKSSLDIALQAREARAAGAITDLAKPLVSELPNAGGQLKPLARMLKDGQQLTLSPAQLTQYLQENRRSAEALLVASRLTNDLALLRQAAQTFPEDPYVQLELAIRGATPEERRKALEAFRQTEPDNALGDYLSALDHFRQGRPDAAVQDLLASKDRSYLGDHSLEMLQSSEDVFLSAGYSAAEAKAAAMLKLQRVQAAPLVELSKKIADLQNQYVRHGDRVSSEAVREIGLQLGQKIQNESQFVIDDLTGMAIERRFLNQLPPTSSYGETGQTVGARLAALDAQREQIKQASGAIDLLPTLGESEAVSYLDRLKLYGELEALRWLEQRRK